MYISLLFSNQFCCRYPVCPQHRRLQDAVGFSFFTTTNRQLPTGTIAVGFSFFTTTNQ